MLCHLEDAWQLSFIVVVMTGLFISLTSTPDLNYRQLLEKLLKHRFTFRLSVQQHHIKCDFCDLFQVTANSSFLCFCRCFIRRSSLVQRFHVEGQTTSVLQTLPYTYQHNVIAIVAISENKERHGTHTHTGMLLNFRLVRQAKWQLFPEFETAIIQICGDIHVLWCYYYLTTVVLLIQCHWCNTQILTLAHFIALGGKCRQGKTKNPAFNGWQLIPGSSLRTS